MGLGLGLGLGLGWSSVRVGCCKVGVRVRVRVGVRVGVRIQVTRERSGRIQWSRLSQSWLADYGKG